MFIMDNYGWLSTFVLLGIDMDGGSTQNLICNFSELSVTST